MKVSTTILIVSYIFCVVKCNPLTTKSDGTSALKVNENLDFGQNERQANNSSTNNVDGTIDHSQPIGSVVATNHSIATPLPQNISIGLSTDPLATNTSSNSSLSNSTKENIPINNMNNSIIEATYENFIPIDDSNTKTNIASLPNEQKIKSNLTYIPPNELLNESNREALNSSFGGETLTANASLITKLPNTPLSNNINNDEDNIGIERNQMQVNITGQSANKLTTGESQNELNLESGNVEENNISNIDSTTQLAENMVNLNTEAVSSFVDEGTPITSSITEEFPSLVSNIAQNQTNQTELFNQQLHTGQQNVINTTDIQNFGVSTPQLTLQNTTSPTNSIIPTTEHFSNLTLNSSTTPPIEENVINEIQPEIIEDFSSTNLLPISNITLNPQSSSTITNKTNIIHSNSLTNITAMQNNNTILPATEIQNEFTTNSSTAPNPQSTIQNTSSVINETSQHVPTQNTTINSTIEISSTQNITEDTGPKEIPSNSSTTIDQNQHKNTTIPIENVNEKESHSVTNSTLRPPTEVVTNASTIANVTEKTTSPTIPTKKPSSAPTLILFNGLLCLLILHVVF